MPKRGYKHYTGVFGNDAEDYLSQLLWMMKNPRGNRRPDLVSINGRYNPKLSIEAKSGIDGKVSLVSYQLHYGITSSSDYEELFGESPPKREGCLEGLNDLRGWLGDNSVAYYYDIISRPREVSSEEITGPFANIKLRWGDQAIVPHDMVFYAFAIARFLRTKERIPLIIEGLKEQMKRDVVEQKSHYLDNKGQQDWQSFYLRDMRALFNGVDPRDWDIATKPGKIRLRLLRKHYPYFGDLERISIPGPNGTTIYVLSKPEDSDLFDQQVRETVAERKPILERVHRARRRALGLLDRLYTEESNLYTRRNGKKHEPLSSAEIMRLRRLAVWADTGQPLEVSAVYDPHVDGCSDEVESEGEFTVHDAIRIAESTPDFEDSEVPI